jgi:hypothetical protein
MKVLDYEQVQIFMEYLEKRIEKHNENIRRSGSYGAHKELYKTEREEA